MKNYIAVALILLLVQQIHAQKIYQGSVEYSTEVVKNGDEVTVKVDMDMKNLKIKRQQMLILSPILISHDNQNIEEYGTFVIAGKKRFKALERSAAYGNSPIEPNATIIKYDKIGEISIPFSKITPYSDWMRHADLNVKEQISGCIDCIVRTNDVTLITDVLPPLFIPEYRVSYVIPPAEPIKERRESHVSRLSYIVGKYDLLREFRNNSSVLDEVDSIMRELINNPDLSVTKFTVTGYASPEGNFNSNLILSQNRAKSFLNYLQTYFGFNVSTIYSEGRGEDWDGLYRAVAASDMQDKSTVLGIIDSTTDIGQRKRYLQSLSGGATYRMLLEEIYPSLRRNEYEISYVARPFDVEEAKSLIRTKPQYLSLNEMYLVAHTYEKESEDFKYIFDVAARMYPDDLYAIQNTAALEIESGSYDSAIRRLMTVETPEALNNIGVAYLKKAEYEQAEKYLQKSARSGNEEAMHNLEQYRKWTLN